MKAVRCRCIGACRSAASTSRTKSAIAVINLGLIEKFIALGKLDTKAEITEEMLVAAGLTGQLRDGIRILAKGEIKSKVTLNVTGASAAAIEAVAAAGGTLTVAAALEPYGKSVRKTA